MVILLLIIIFFQCYIIKVFYIKRSYKNEREILVMKKILIINYDFTNKSEKSYGEIKDVLNMINKEDRYPVIMCTNCLSFFNFDYLKKLDDIIVYKKDKSFISLKDLLENKGKGYCAKEIREAHNVYKLLISGLLDFKKDIEAVEKDIALKLYLMYLRQY